MTELQKKIIKCYARNDMNLSVTADELHYNPNALRYHMKKIYEETGFNPRKFYGLCKLLFSVMGGDIDDL